MQGIQEFLLAMHEVERSLLARRARERRMLGEPSEGSAPSNPQHAPTYRSGTANSAERDRDPRE